MTAYILLTAAAAVQGLC